MSGSNNEITNSGGPASGTEPSMEEILASIRRILSNEQRSGQESAPEDDAEDDEILVLDSSMAVRPAPDFAPDFASAPLPAVPPEPPEPQPMEVLTADPPVFEAPEEPPAHLTSAPSEPDYPAVENATFDLPLLDASPNFYPEPEPEPESGPAADAADHGPTGAAKEIYMSDDQQESLQPPHGIVGEAASQAAASSIGSLIRSISSERSIAIGRPGLTLEDLVREELRPLLKSWLDSNLPALVERIVRAEIQRVIERST